MLISEFISILLKTSDLEFRFQDGKSVPPHFHITEVGLVSKKFVDCGGIFRAEEVISFQIWTSNDTDHRLTNQKLVKIISLANNLFEGKDLPIEFEYQGQTIGKYGLELEGNHFLLTNKFTTCLAQDSCGVKVKEKKNLSEFTKKEVCCEPSTGCC